MPEEPPRQWGNKGDFNLANSRIHGMAMVTPGEGWAVGDQGTILHYSNGAWGLYQV